MQKLSGRKLLLIGFTLFSMFFGAGNLIFPPDLGAKAGIHFWPAFLGLAISAVGLPVAGVVAVARAQGLEKLAGRYIDAYGREVFDTWDIKVEKDFAALPLALQSRVIRILVRNVGGAELSYDHVRKILDMIARGVGNKSLDVPGNVRLIYLNGRLMVGKISGPGKKNGPPSWHKGASENERNLERILIDEKP